ncbi:MULTISPECIES: hypothetical protein [Acinetobacter]|uniref:Secreted protein n=1 Tax=Acinetobacter pollinis TaxID=2605270 RepID=A0ABU6DVA2_9GAMM|nr:MULTISPECIES: hypothetical protein [Acinetobacter]MBF7690575.1 hypothetical protein [Acinetobacter pollinis]MBF7693553.1 hypothetical protein [Acinetobacter pollinis]MBF7698059.1 hypothetical protein [Acinetobacter pollinis]MBF7701086.1 hypothetical protein [Acinetobacter pollinis]MEB5477789.1 hypothetical protein [Acinetobacter pollinis]
MGKIITTIGLATGLLATTAFAEPAVESGQTLESLSQAQVSTTVNGQPGSLKSLLQSGQYTLVSPDSNVQQTPNDNTDQQPASTPAGM